MLKDGELIVPKSTHKHMVRRTRFCRMVSLIHPGDHLKMENVAKLEDVVVVAVVVMAEAVVVVAQTKSHSTMHA